MSDVLQEITQLSPRDCFHIVERHKTEFDYPLHCHKEFELNFIQHAPGVRRIVGDSVEEIGDIELALIGGENLEHQWEQGDRKYKDIREITIHFAPDLLGGAMLEKNQFTSIRHMLDSARNGLSFPPDAIMKVYYHLDTIANQEDSFPQFLSFITILYELSKSDWKELASSSFAPSGKEKESRRVLKIKDYIAEHYREDVSLEELADLVGMSQSALSRFFKQRTGSTISNYLIDTRLGHASRELVDTTRNISEICYECGFGNISNFGRLFKERKGVTPKEFRQLYKKKKVIV